MTGLHPADTRCGGGRQLAAVGWEEREAQDPLLPLPPAPAHSRDASGPGLGTGGCPTRGTGPYKRTG